MGKLLPDALWRGTEGIGRCWRILIQESFGKDRWWAGGNGAMWPFNENR